MNFPALEAAALAFADRINSDLGRSAIKPITLETPQPPPDELYFNRLVAWCYGFFFEAAVDVLKECRALMKQNSPERTNQYMQSTRNINSLRTYKFHNLPPGGENDRKKAAAKAWLTEFEQGSQGMARASERLCAEAHALIDDVMRLWVEATVDAGDAAQLIKRVQDALDQCWPPHELDDMVRETALEFQLNGFDAKAFREEHLAAWRKVGNCFEDRASGADGIRRAIRRTMHQTFGPSV